jgi:hypothetical protein
MRRIVSQLGNPICTAIVHTPAKDSRASPGHGRIGPRGPATVRGQARLPRRGKRREDTGGNWRAALHDEPSGQRSASKANDRDRPVRDPGATCRRPPADPRRHQAQASPYDQPAHPILPLGGRFRNSRTEGPQPRPARLKQGQRPGVRPSFGTRPQATPRDLYTGERPKPVGAENLCHLGKCPRDRGGSVKRLGVGEPVLARPEVG